MALLQLLRFSSLLALASTACVLPPTPASNPYPTSPFAQAPLNDGRIMFFCEGNNFIVGDYAAGGSLLADFSTSYICDPNVGKFLSDNGQESVLTTMACSEIPTDPGLCGFTTNGVIYVAQNQQSGIKCPAGQVFEDQVLGEVASLSCNAAVTYATLANGTKVNAQADGLLPEAKCVAAKATTTTAATTTTVKPDSPASAGHLWNFVAYYNYGFGVHAFCADQNCINVIQKNGIGYDMVNGKVIIGRTVTESAIASVRASCPTGSANLRNLGFTKSGNKYLHNLHGGGLKQGWVSATYGACGATVPIKRWKSRYTDDMMYGIDLEWNTWYKGMVQDGGAVQFYIWA